MWGIVPAARFADPEHVEGAACTIIEGRDAGFDFDDGVAHGFESKAAVDLGEDFRIR